MIDRRIPWRSLGGARPVELSKIAHRDAKSLRLRRSSSAWGQGQSRLRNLALDRKALGSATLATSAVAKAGPTPGMSSSRAARCRAYVRFSFYST